MIEISIIETVISTFVHQVSLGLITSKASYVVWPPRNMQRLLYELPDPARVQASYHDDSRAASNDRRPGVTPAVYLGDENAS